MVVEQIGNERKVQLRVTSNQRGRGQELSALELFGLLENFFRSFQKISCLDGRSGAAVLASNLGKQNGVVLAILDVGGEVGDSVESC